MSIAPPAERTVLLVCPHFPPSTLAGVHRGRHLAKHLKAAGWRPIVVTVDPEHYVEQLDPALANLLPNDLTLIRTGAIPAGLARRLGVGDIGLRSLGHLRRAIRNAIEQYQPALVFITGSPYYPMLLAPWIRERLGKPVVLDFQDPWVSNWGASRPPMSKAGLAHRLARLLEPVALRQASFITSVSEIQNKQLAERYPWIDASRMAAIPIGADPDDGTSLSCPSLRGRYEQPSGSRPIFSYVGTVMPRSMPLFDVLFEAIAMLATTAPDIAPAACFRFVGTSNQAHANAAPQLTELSERFSLTNLIREYPARAPYLEALQTLEGSTALLLIGSDERHYTASKIYPALMSGRPFLSLFHRASSAHAILSAAGGGYAFAFDSPAELAALAPEISRALAELARTPEAAGKVRAEVIAQYTAAAVAGKFAAIFDKVAGTA